MPPTPEELDAFLGDHKPDAYERVVNRLLRSPAVAERLAVDWLDGARYADTNGYSIDDHRDMWIWRDWVLNAFLTNKRFDEFTVEQIAGDLLPGATEQQRVATGFLRNSMNTHEGGTIPEEYRVIYNVDKVDTVATVFMGLTMKCAQCHDHKYDPISQKEFYQFYAFFNQSSEPGSGATNANTGPLIEAGSAICSTRAGEAGRRRAYCRIKASPRCAPGAQSRRSVTGGKRSSWRASGCSKAAEQSRRSWFCSRKINHRGFGLPRTKLPSRSSSNAGSTWKTIPAEAPTMGHL